MGADREVVVANSGAPATEAVAQTPAAHVGPASAAHASASVCANCGAPISGHFCSNCGQRVEHAVHSVWHFASEAVEDLTHADSRLWGTVGALLFKPGFLTCEFLAGRRVKYLPPLRLYLVLSLLYFVIGALDHGNETKFVVMAPEDYAANPAQPLVPRSDAERRQRADRMCSKLGTHGAWGAVLGQGCHKAVADNGRALSETFNHNLPRAIFLSLPILALALKPLYRRYYVEHLLFLLHDHAFIFLWFTVYNAVCLLIPGEVAQESLVFVFAAYVPYYYFRAMRRVYGDGRWRTFGKFTVLSLAYLMVDALLLVATGTYSVLAQ